MIILVRPAWRVLTGIDDPYEEPHHAEIQLDTEKYSPEENSHSIVDYLLESGFMVTQE